MDSFKTALTLVSNSLFTLNDAQKRLLAPFHSAPLFTQTHLWLFTTELEMCIQQSDRGNDTVETEFTSDCMLGTREGTTYWFNKDCEGIGTSLFAQFALLASFLTLEVMRNFIQ